MFEVFKKLSHLENGFRNFLMSYNKAKATFLALYFQIPY